MAAMFQVLLQLMKIRSGGREKVIESTLSSALFSGMLCDSVDAKTNAFRIALQLIARAPMNADTLLSGVVSKKGSIENAAQRAAACRFISIVVRHAKLEKKSPAVTQLMALANGLWEQPENLAVAAAAGSAVAALCTSATISDDDVNRIAETALRMCKNTASNTLMGGVACLYTLLMSVPARCPAGLASAAADVMKPILANVPADRTAMAWTLRLFGAICGVNPAAALPLVDFVVPVARRLHRADDMLLGTLEWVTQRMQPDAALWAKATPLTELYAASTAICLELGLYDADIEDEVSSEAQYF
jgi:hypothetical protein